MPQEWSVKLTYTLPSDPEQPRVFLTAIPAPSAAVAETAARERFLSAKAHGKDGAAVIAVEVSPLG